MRLLSAHLAWVPWLAAAAGIAALLATSCPGRAPNDDDDAGEGEGEGEAGEGEGETGEGEGEGEPPPPVLCPDTGASPGDVSLQGTPFETMAVTWDRTLTLCGAWTEGADIDNELGKKVRVVMPPQSRPSFGAQDLARSGLIGVSIERGVSANQRFQSSVCFDEGAQDEWTIDESNPEFPVLRATMRWDFAGAGTVFEYVAVGAQAGQPVPDVAYGDDLGIVAFGYEGGGTSAYLDDCADLTTTPEPYYGALELIVAAQGGDSIALLRAFDTFDTFAGSFPVQWKSSVVARSDAPFVYAKAFDYWPHTYAAQHHNWQETSRIDFDRDLANYHAFFSEDAAQSEGRALKTIKLQDIDNFAEAPRLETTDVDLASRDETVLTWDVSSVVHVDATALERALRFTNCEDGDVKGVGLPGYDSYVLQLLLCPRVAAPGYEVGAIVPVLMGSDMSVLGQTFDAPVESVVDGQANWHFALTGTTSVDVRHFSDDGTVIVTIDEPGDSDYATLALPARLDTILPEPDETLLMQSEDGSVALDIVRHRVGQGVGESSIFAPVSTALRFGETRLFTDGFDAQKYTNTHHNWNDGLEATARHEEGDVTITWLIEVDFKGEEFLIYTVSATQNGTEILAPTRVRPTFTNE